MAWTADLKLDHPELDRQHAGLFDLLEAAVAALESGRAEPLAVAVAAFSDAMMRHAVSEEALMEESLYPERGRHRVAHEVFLADLQQLQAEVATRGASQLAGEWLRVRLPEWLRFHIAMNDLPLGRHLAQRPGPPRGQRRSDSRRTS